MKRLLSIFLFQVILSTISGQEFDSITDARDGQVYKIVKIGNQWWMAENLKAIKYSDGTAIPYVDNELDWRQVEYVDKAYTFQENDVNLRNTYGILYTWAAAMNGAATSNSVPSGIQGVCPTGWHIPSDEEWIQLEMNLGMSRSEADAGGTRGTDEGGKLKEVGVSHWASPNLGATNSSGFTALPGGRCDLYGIFRNLGEYAEFWSTTAEVSSEGEYRRLHFDNNKIREGGRKKDHALSVRCVSDTPATTHETFTAGITDSMNISCFGASDGTATCIATGGIMPYSIIWDDDSLSNTEIVYNLTANKWYHVTVTDQAMESIIDSVILTEPDKPNISKEKSRYTCPGENSGYLNINVVGQSPPYTLFWSTGDTSKHIENLSAGKYWMTITDSNDCVISDTTVIDTLSTFQDEEICVVTIGKETGKNIIVWEKTPDVGIASYNIYRESSRINEYELIGTKLYDDFSIFTDTVAEPEKHPDTYKITIVDSCGNESDINNTPFHIPLFLQYDGSTDGVNLGWEKYQVENGEIHFVTYEIHRGESPTNLYYIDDVSSRQFVYTDTDPIVFDHKYYCRVVGVLLNPCYPSGGGLKAGAGPYQHSMSNLEDNKIGETGLERMYSSGGLFIFPNPFNNQTTIQFPNPEQIPHTLEVMDLTGKVVKEISDIQGSQFEFHSYDLENGVYIIELTGPKIYRGKIVIE